MSAYSKLIGTIIASLLGLAASKYGLPAEFNTPEVVGALTALAGAVGTYIAPANKT